VEFIPTKKAMKEFMMKFLEEKIITRFGVPAKINTDNTKAFSSVVLNEFCFKYGIVLSHSSNYYPQGNGLEKSNNKKSMKIVNKIVGENNKSWDSKIKYALWANRTTTKTSTGKTPFDLVYGFEARLPINIQISTLQIAQKFSTDKEALQGRIDQLIELDETQRMAFDQMARNREKINRTFNRNERQRDFKEGDRVLSWDKRREKPRMHQKFDILWIGPYKIEEVFGSDSFYLSTTDGRRMPLPINGSLLKHYFQGGT
jgi:hypothetical protein